MPNAKIRLIHISLFTALSGCFLWATSPVLAEVSTLEEALISAYHSNPTLLAERARLRQTDEGVAQAISGWRPTVTARGSFTHVDRDASREGVDNLNNPVTLDVSEVTDVTTIGIAATQTLYRGGRTLNELRRAKANVRAGRAQLIAKEQSVLLEATSAYWNVVRDKSVLALAENNVDVLKRQFDAVQERFKINRATRTDLVQSKARLRAAESNFIAAKAQFAASRAGFVRIIGDLPGAVSDQAQLPELPGNLEEALAFAKQNNPDIQAALESERASRRGIAIETGALLPTISIEASYTDRHTSSDRPLAASPFSLFTGDSESDTVLLGATVSVPLYQGGRQYSRLREAKQANSEDRLQIIETERRVEEQVIVAWEDLEAARSTIEASKDLVAANETAVEGVRAEASVGKRLVLDVLDAEQELLDAQVSLVRAERDAFVTAFSLLAAIGKLTARDLNLSTDYLYDPEVHYDSVKLKPLGWWSKDQ